MLFENFMDITTSDSSNIRRTNMNVMNMMNRRIMNYNCFEDNDRTRNLKDKDNCHDGDFAAPSNPEAENYDVECKTNRKLRNSLPTSNVPNPSKENYAPATQRDSVSEIDENSFDSVFVQSNFCSAEARGDFENVEGSRNVPGKQIYNLKDITPEKNCPIQNAQGDNKGMEDAREEMMLPLFFSACKDQYSESFKECESLDAEVKTSPDFEEVFSCDFENLECSNLNSLPNTQSSTSQTRAVRPSSLSLMTSESKCIEIPQDGKNRRQRRKKRLASESKLKTFDEVYEATGERLGSGSFGAVLTYINRLDKKEYAVKMIESEDDYARHKVLKEIEILYLCRGHDHVVQMIEYFEESFKFFMVFQKMEGGTLLKNIQDRGHLDEREAATALKQIADALHLLHQKGIAHRDLKPENVLCEKRGQLLPVRIGDFDLSSDLSCMQTSPISTPQLQTPVGSVEFMAPEVVDVWTEQAWSYDKRCDLWSLGIILFIMLCGCPPFSGQCGNECGWDEGQACQLCQDQLFSRIKEGVYQFPPHAEFSEEAKDLISHLLERDPLKRYSVVQVLRHPWLTESSAQKPLLTPQVLRRTDSVRHLDEFALNALACDRLLCQISLAQVDSNNLNSSSSENTLTGSYESLQLSPPGSSSLAQRRIVDKLLPSEIL